MSSATLRLVLLVSCAHALVHVYELAFPSVEELVQADYGVEKRMMGWLGNCWRFPFGLGALFAGMLVDRFGAKWMLVIYLLGCAGTSALAGARPELPLLFATMFVMGSFASIYHPAGLALISHETRPEDRPRALGYHGIFGSAGIALAPFLAGFALMFFPNWESYFVLLVVPGVLLAAVIGLRLIEHHRQVDNTVTAAAAAASPAAANSPSNSSTEDGADWRAFFILTVSGLLSGLVYAALVNFWPRYLNIAEIRPEGIPARSFRNYLTGGVLVMGIAGQYAAGRFGRAGKLQRQLACILFAAVPLLFWMAFAEGLNRVVASAAVSFVLFMQQPVYNSLIAQFVPRRRRSSGYGFSNAMAFGGGSFGASFAGMLTDDRVIYSILAVLALLSGGVAVLLARMARRSEE